VKDGKTSDEPPGSQIMVARPKSLVPGPNSSSEASPFTGSQHLLKALRTRVKVSLGILRNSRADLSIRLSWYRAYQSRPLRVTHRLESRMREIRTSGSEGGVGSIPISTSIRPSTSRSKNLSHAAPQLYFKPSQAPATVQTSPPVSSPVIIPWASSPPFPLEIAMNLVY
jgi:hypothetical protein